MVDHVRAIEVAGIDVVDAARHRFTQHGDCRVAIFRRAEYAGTGELHSAVAEPLHSAAAELEYAGFIDAGSRKVGHWGQLLLKENAELGPIRTPDNTVQFVQTVRSYEQWK